MFGRKNGCRYFIDSENVNEVWVNILNILKPEDTIFLFYTDNSAHISCAKAVELINIGAKRIKGIRCKEGNNGLDFQMVTQLGAVISKEPKCEYILVSNDNGFDAVVSYWKQKGYNIRREKSSYCVSLQIPDPDKPDQKTQKKTTGKQNYYNSKNRNRPRIENKKDYRRQQPKLEDKKQQSDNKKQQDGKKAADQEAKKARRIENESRKETVALKRGTPVPEEKTVAQEMPEKTVVPETPEATITLEASEATIALEASEETIVQETPEATIALEALEETIALEAPGDEDQGRHDDDFEPMERPVAIPGMGTVSDDSRVVDTMYCLQSLCSLIPRKNMALFHNALTCIFEQKDGDEIYAAVKTHPELHTQLWSRYEQDREERIRKYICLLLDISDYEIQDTDLLYQVYRESYDGSLQGLNIGIMKAFGDETGIRYYRLLRKHINVLTKL